MVNLCGGAAGPPAVLAIAAAAKELVELGDNWLDLAHGKLDRLVPDAYGWPHEISDEAILEKLLELNLARAKSN